VILIYKLPSVPDGYVGVLTAPHTSVTWLARSEPRGSLRGVAVSLGVEEAELDAVLKAADRGHFGAAVSRREPATVETRLLTYPGFSLLLKHAGGYVGVVTGTPWAPKRRVRGALRYDWIFTKPITRNEVSDGMYARGHNGIDIVDLLCATDKNGWGYG